MLDAGGGGLGGGLCPLPRPLSGWTELSVGSPEASFPLRLLCSVLLDAQHSVRQRTTSFPDLFPGSSLLILRSSPPGRRPLKHPALPPPLGADPPLGEKATRPPTPHPPPPQQRDRGSRARGRVGTARAPQTPRMTCALHGHMCSAGGSMCREHGLLRGSHPTSNSGFQPLSAVALTPNRPVMPPPPPACNCAL